MAVIRMPARHNMPQINRKREHPVGIISGQDGTAVRADLDAHEFRDQYGNTVKFNQMAGKREWQIMRRYFVDILGVIKSAFRWCKFRREG